ncbi:RNA polymerase sigma-70 factor [Ornithinibacillus californiensis]|uniref:RNA polymerase sigma-70 factor n=1 Tax=Ornithinibacillus californiensis TaxID=161536 RepID=UPI00069F0D8B|nr:RNA polymerase sigma-70 factor [Ornithinibacillus californiensis]
MEIDQLYQNYKPLLFTLAYQLTGTRSDAEDVVQDVFVKLHGMDVQRLEHEKAYLCKMVTNQCLDYLKSARMKREQYVGTWLPEPVRTTPEDLSDIVIQNDLLSYAMLVVMERLTNVERAVFVLKEAYSFDYRTIAEMVDKSEVNCRKLYSRAKEKLGTDKEMMNPQQIDKKWMENLLSVLQVGDIEQLLPLLSEDVTVYSDGGGKVPAAVHPIRTPELVLRFLGGLLKRLPMFGESTRFKAISINGEEGLVLYNDQEIILVAMFELDSNLLKNIYFIRNPDKLEILKHQLINTVQ